MTNRAIAHKLTVSAKTVSGQLSAIYRKLGVHDRAALAAAMQEGGNGERSLQGREPEPVA
jgi:DNA-binding NarL/FixJ family response regulator